MVEIVKYTYLVKFNSGSRGKAPVGVWGEAPQKPNVFFPQNVFLKKKFCRYWHDLSVAVCYSVCHTKSHLNNSKTDYPIYVKFSANICQLQESVRMTLMSHDLGIEIWRQG